MIRTRGLHGYTCWIETYTIQYSSDGSNWNNVTSSQTGEALQFTANTDGRSNVENRFDPPFTARYVQMNVVSANTMGCGRWQLVQETPCSGTTNTYTK